MSVYIKLRNGRVMDAQPLENDLFEAILASGKAKIYAFSDLLSVEDVEVQEAPVITNKEDSMTIYHYLHEATFGEGDKKFVAIVRMVTTTLPDHIVARYEDSQVKRTTVGGVFALNTGTWQFNLLENTLIKSGDKFTLMIMSNGDVLRLDVSAIDAFINRSTFAYANASYTFFFRVDGETNFGLTKLGISIEMAKKSAKRLQELFRQSEMSLMLSGDDEMDTVSIAFPDVSGPTEYVDGKSYIRRSFALRCIKNVSSVKRRARLYHEIMSGKLNHVSWRGMTPAGLFKGDAVICPNSQLSADIVTHESNLKTELTTEDYMFFTMWEHKHDHLAVWDDQSAINFGHALSEKAHTSDIYRLVNVVRANIEAGTLPEWLLLGESDHNDDGTPDMERLSDTINKSWIRWQAHGLDVRAAQNLTFMALGGIVKRMDGVKINGFYKKTWVPMTNATLLTINTWESATRLGGFSFPGRDKNTSFYDARVGFILSGRRFVETYNLHGGWDLDDSMKVVKVKVWCSDPDILKLHLGKTVPSHVPYFANEKDAREMVLLVRSPNGPGEWSIEECDTSTLPIHEDLCHNDVTVIDIAQMPLPQDYLIAGTNVLGIPTSSDYSHEEMMREDSTAMINAQVTNPGVGRFCNAMMVWACANDGFPGIMLGKMEDIVDTCQQGFDAEAFAAIGIEHNSIMDQVIHSGNPIDTALAYTRATNAYRSEMTLVQGRFTRVQKAYVAAINTIKEELQMHTLQMRAIDPTIKIVKRMSFGGGLFRWAENFYGVNNRRFAEVDNKFNAKGETNPFRKMQMQNNHKLAMEAIVSDMVTEVQALDDRHILALWKYVNSATSRHIPYGVSDRIIFQPNTTGELSLMDLLIEAIINHGLL